jgi:hypothetical protein
MNHRTRIFSAQTIAAVVFALGTMIPAIASAGNRLSYCGADGQRPCRIIEAFPSCDGDLAENFITDRCQQPAWPWAPPGRPSGCGHEGQRPCDFFEFVPSCESNLAETFASPNTCQAMQPGDWSPFFAGIRNFSAAYGSAITDAKALCRSWATGLIAHGTLPGIGAVPGIEGGVKTSEGQCPAYIGAGFICETPSLLELFQVPNAADIFGALEEDFEAEYHQLPCADIVNPGERTACAASMVIFNQVMPGASAATQCFVKAVNTPGIWDALMPGQSFMTGAMCMDIGSAMFELGMMAIESRTKVAQGGSKAGAKTHFQTRRTQKFASAPASARTQLDTDRAAGKADYKNMVTNILSMIGNADQVAGILAGIPECEAEATGAEAILDGRVFYEVNSSGQLVMSRHTSAGFGIVRTLMGTGWNDASKVFAAAGGHVYLVNQGGGLQYYRHSPNGGWDHANGQTIGTGWDVCSKVFAARMGEIYCVKYNGDLYYYEHDKNLAWTNWGTKIGLGFDAFTFVFSGGHHVIYGLTPGGHLYRYQHNDNFQWEIGELMRTDLWSGQFQAMGSTGNGDIYAFANNGDLKHWKHDVNGNWVTSWSLVGWGWGTIGPFGMIPAPY